MTDMTVKKTEDFNTTFRGAFKRVRAGLGVSSFGLAVIDFPPNADQYPEHDHRGDGQEEVYSALAGRATIRVGDEEHELVPGVWVRVGPGERRKITTGPESARIIAIGATPGEVYVPPTLSEPAQLDTVGPDGDG
jgi:quercetin dioxygenase-like cupin family protein